MIKFNFISTILRFSQIHSLTRRALTSYSDFGREVVAVSLLSVLGSLQPASDNIIEMLPGGDWSKAEYILFGTTGLDVQKQDLLLDLQFGDLKCMKIFDWTDYGVLVAGFVRTKSNDGQ